VPNGLSCLDSGKKVSLRYAGFNPLCLFAGVNTAIYSPSGANSGVGFAIPVDVVKSSVQQIIQYGKVVRPILGIQFAPDQSEQVSIEVQLHLGTD
jgi:hypothetical protein